MNLYPFQQEGVRWLRRNRKAYLADEMGLGKTVQAIVAARLIPHERPAIICPASVQQNWRREWETWDGPGRPRITSHSRVGSRGGWPGPYEPDLLIADEAHYWKTPSARRTKAGLKLAQEVHDRGGYVWLLSATPIPNDPREIYAVMRALWPELLPRQPDRPDLPLNQTQFLKRYCRYTMTEWGPRVFGLTDLAKTELRDNIASFMLRRRWPDVELQLPPLRVDLQLLPPDKEVERKIRELREPGDDPEILATLRRLLGEYKAPLVSDLLADELQAGELESVVVFYHHTNTGDEMADALGGYGVRRLDGSMSVAERQQEIDGFQAGNGRVFLVQQQAGGVGITLTRSHEAVLIEPDWSPAVNEQAIARIWRIGQGHPCRARLFAMPDTLDEAVMKRLIEKTSIQQQLGMESSQ